MIKNYKVNNKFKKRDQSYCKIMIFNNKKKKKINLEQKMEIL